MTSGTLRARFGHTWCARYNDGHDAILEARAREHASFFFPSEKTKRKEERRSKERNNGEFPVPKCARCWQVPALTRESRAQEACPNRARSVPEVPA